MDRRTLLAITLCFGIFLAWQKFYIEPRMAQMQQSTQERQAQPTLQSPSSIAPGQPNSSSNPQATAPGGTTGATASGNTMSPSTHPGHPPQTLVVETGTGQAIAGDSSRFFAGWRLKSYQQGLEANTAAVDLKSVTNQDGQLELAFDDPSFAYLTNVQGDLKSVPQGAVWTYEDSNVKLQRDYASATPAQPYLDLTLQLTFKNKHPNYAFVSLTSETIQNDPEENDRQLVYFSNDSLERIHIKGGVKLKEVATPLKFIGSANRYFLMALVNNSPIPPRGLIQPLAPNVGRISLVFPITANSMTIPLKAFFGPKELQTLRAVDPALDNTVDFGWFTIFAYPLLKILKWLYQFVGNYGVAIILLTVLLKIATYPLTYKSMKSMREMAKLQPQLQKIREQHKDDREALNRETLNIMRTHGYNPVAGCLPIFIQMPIFFALYRVLYSSIELYHAPLAGWIRDLSVRDPYFITPIVLSGSMFLQQKLTPNTATDPAQQKMLQFMPLIFGFMMMNLPAGLTLYMLTNALSSIVQQLILNKKLNISSHAPAVPASAR